MSPFSIVKGRLFFSSQIWESSSIKLVSSSCSCTHQCSVPNIWERIGFSLTLPPSPSFSLLLPLYHRNLEEHSSLEYLWGQIHLGTCHSIKIRRHFLKMWGTYFPLKFEVYIPFLEIYIDMSVNLVELYVLLFISCDTCTVSNDL